MPGLFKQFSNWIKLHPADESSLSTKDKHLRQKILFEIGELKDPGALPTLLPLLHDPDADHSIPRRGSSRHDQR